VSLVAPAPSAPSRPRRSSKPAPAAPRRTKPRTARTALARPRAGRSPVTPGVIWVLLLATLFGGIVALNVGALRSSIAASQLDGEAAALRSQNADLEALIAARSGYGRISQLAQGLGMVPATPSTRDYLRLHPARSAPPATGTVAGSSGRRATIRSSARFKGPSGVTDRP
jgi:hypothetical protein